MHRDEVLRSPEPSHILGHSTLAVMRKAGGSTPLFCMHDTSFRDIAAALPAEQTIWVLGCPKLGQPDGPSSVEVLAQSHTVRVREIQPHGPYQLIGYSFGGLVAYEMAALFAESGEQVHFVALVDVVNPSFYRDLSVEDAKQVRRTYVADRLTKYMQNFVGGEFGKLRADARRLVTRKLDRILRRVTREVVSRLRGPASVIKTPDELCESYVPRELTGHLVLLRAEKAMDGGTEYDRDPTLGWGKYVRGRIDVELLPGTHETIIRPPNAGELARRLALYLR